MTESRRGVFMAVTLAAVLLVPGHGLAQQATPDDLKKEIEALKKGMEEIQKDLRDIKALLQARQQPAGPQNITVDLAGVPMRGDPKAPLTLLEFTDYQCPFCGRHVRDTYPQLEKEYIATGKLRYVVLDLPLESIHKLAFKAAQAVHCANDQGKFWEMHDRLFANQATLDAWATHAEAVGIDAARFEQCLDEGKYADAVRKTMAQVQAAGVSGTPHFYLAPTDPSGSKVTTVRAIRGAQPFAAFKAQIDALLAEQTK